MVAAFEKHSPPLIEPVTEALDSGKMDLYFHRLDAKSWSSCESISVDFAVMEKADNLVAVEYTGAWSDLGNWNAVWENPVTKFFVLLILFLLQVVLIWS